MDAENCDVAARGAKAGIAGWVMIKDMLSTISLPQLLSRIDASTNILCGAGVSMATPTGLPSGNRLRDLCVRGLLEDLENKTLIDLLLKAPGYQRLLPEAVLQEVGLFASRHVDSLMVKVLARARPNHVHTEIASRFSVIFTTNFDSCFERAGAQRVVHLHGTIDDPSSLQNRVFRLGKGRDEDIQFFESSLRACPLLVLGYSLRDEDVIESISRAQPDPILFLSFDGEAPAFLARTTATSFLAKGSAEDLFPSSRVSEQLPQEMSREVSIRKPPVGARASALMFLVYLSGLYELAPEILNFYLPKLTGRTRYKAVLSAADSLRIVGRYSEAVRLCELVLSARFCQRPDQVDQLVTANNLLALCELDNGGDYERADYHFRQALAYLQEYRERYLSPSNAVGIEIFRARIMNNRGLLHAAKGKYSCAVREYGNSREIKLAHHDDRGVAQTDSNLAKCFLQMGDYARAAQSLREVVLRMRKSPDRYLCQDALSELLPLLGQAAGLQIDLDLARPKIDAETWAELEGRLAFSSTGQLEILRELQELDRLYRDLYQT